MCFFTVYYVNQYSGAWSGCPEAAPCGAGLAVETRDFVCVALRSTPPDTLTGVVTLEDSLCDGSSKRASSRPCFQVCEHHRRQYSWRAGPWTSCRQLPQQKQVFTTTSLDRCRVGCSHFETKAYILL